MSRVAQPAISVRRLYFDDVGAPIGELPYRAGAPASARVKSITLNRERGNAPFMLESRGRRGPANTLDEIGTQF